MELPQRFFEHRRIENMVENRTTYTVENAELNVYETHHFAEEVFLQFHQPVFASMLEGKKIMYLKDQDPFYFLPGQSVMMPSDEIMKIDFPEAAENNPTRCLAMTISPDKLNHIVSDMNDAIPKENDEWRLGAANYTFSNDAAVSQIIQRLMFLFMENHTSKDLFVDMMLKELMVRILQSENRSSLKSKSEVSANSHRIASIICFIRNNLEEKLQIPELSRKACMSESNFFKVFRNEMGLTPTEFINEERIKKATLMLRDPSIKIKEVYLACGFNNISYFVRTFKKMTGRTPSEYQAFH